MAVDDERAVGEEVAGRVPGPLRTAPFPVGVDVGPAGTERPPDPRPRYWAVAVVGACVAVQLLHAFVVAHAYFVGSFDDDANYILTAKALLAGGGLTGHLTNGESVVASYPPGFPLLLAPILAVLAHGYVALQVYSALLGALVFPLTWIYLGRRNMPDSVRVGTLVLLALNVVLATFSAMVMAETSFLVCLLLLLLAVDRWEATARVMSPVGLAAIVLAATAVWLKEAGLGLVLGVVVWLLLRRQFRKAVAVAAGLGLSLVPVLVARLIDHVPLAGARYSEELGTYYTGGLVSRVVDVLPHAAWHYLIVALPATVVPWGSPLPVDVGVWRVVELVVAIQVTVFTAAGLVICVRRYRDAAVVAVPAYILETVFWPDVNERRVILVLPILLAWYALGVRAAVLASARLVRRLAWPARPVRIGWSMLGVLVLLVPLAVQFPRDYLFGLGQASSQPDGSRYMQMLSALQPASTVVETDYKYSTALFTGHRTADSAFLDVIAGGCSEANATMGVDADDAGWLLLGDLNKPGLIDNSCLLNLATTQPWAVRLMRTNRDSASVFELIGPGTAHPDLVNLMAGSALESPAAVFDIPVRSLGAGDNPGTAWTTPSVGGAGAFTWTFAGPESVSQVSVGEAGVLDGRASGVQLQVLTPAGIWEVVAAAPRAVGDTRGSTPFLLADLPPGTTATALRVVIRGTGRLVALDVAALGSRVPSGR